jgi:rhamnosyltransferase
MDKISGVIISFNGGSSLVSTIRAVANQVSTLIIVDNGSDAETLKILELIEIQKLATVLRLDRNYGIAYALNRGVEILLLENANWIITFDQDSTPLEGMVQNMLDFAKYKKQNGSTPLLLAPVISYNHELLPCLDKYSYENRLFAITSGNMVNAKVFNKIGLYDENFFIDSVDFDFCLRSQLAGYQIFRVNSAILNHNLGQSTQYHIFGIPFHTYTHSPLRRYYIVRNHLYLQKKYLSRFPYFFLKKNFFMFSMIMQILLFEGDKITNIKMMVIGIKHYFEGTKGQFI